jgi:pyruvate/2-oxoglutarate dehydrogenase complex dihydrolipoamide dehydrogenase (E3) component
MMKKDLRSNDLFKDVHVCMDKSKIEFRLNEFMELQHFDVLILGAGSAGYAAAKKAIAAGLKVGLVDGADPLGGLCLLKGCMPSKALIEVADRILHLREADEFGIKTNGYQIDFNQIMERKKRLIDDFAQYRQQQLISGSWDLIRGMARFIDDYTIQVQLKNNTIYCRAKTILIATGSVPQLPKIKGLEKTPYWGSDDVLEMKTVPKSITILGAGAIALEMAHLLEAFGSKVTILQRNQQILTGFDAVDANAVEAYYLRRGIKINKGTTIEEVEWRPESGFKVQWRGQDGEMQSLHSERLLVALGRQPNSRGLSLEVLSKPISFEPRSPMTPISPNTELEHLFIAGDVSGQTSIVHEAIQSAEIAADQMIALVKKQVFQGLKYSLQTRVYGVFSYPQAAKVGFTAADLGQMGIDFVEGRYPLNDHGKSMIKGVREGEVCILASRSSGRILGASAIGPDANEWIHELVLAIEQRLTLQEIIQCPHYHPTLSEIWTYPAEEAEAMR